MTESIQIRLETHSFSFSKQFTKMLEEFSYKHQNEGRIEFKKSWINWIENENIKLDIESEIKILVNEKDFKGTKDDIYSKIFNSVRYYFRKKILHRYTLTCKEPPFTTHEGKGNKRSLSEEPLLIKGPLAKDKLGPLSKSIIKCMDTHVYEYIIKQTIKNNQTQLSVTSVANPADSYEDFCINNKNELLKEVGLLYKKEAKPHVKEVILKFKKAYKNRFYKTREQISKKGK